MTGLFFIRHAQTDMAGTFCGQSDPPINSVGKPQVRELLQHLAPQSFSAIYSSDLVRASQTARALAESFDIPLTTTAHLREIHFGEWEGLTWTEIEQRNPDYAHRWLGEFPALPAPGGESFSAFEDRVLPEVERLRRLAENNRIAVVTHGGVMRLVLTKLLRHADAQAWEMTKAYCSSFAYGSSLARREVCL